MFELGLTQYLPFIAYFSCIAIMLLSIFYDPKIGLYFVTLLIPLQSLREKLIEFPFGKNIMDLLFVSLFLGILFHKKKDVNAPKEKSIYYAIIIFILVSYSSLWVGHFKLGLPVPLTLENTQLADWKNFIMLLLLFFMTLKIINNRRDIIIIISIMALTVFLMDIRFYQDAKFYDYSHYSNDLRNIGSAFAYMGPNESAGFLAEFNMFLIGFLLLDKSKLRRIVFLGLILFNFYSILYYFSRSAYLVSFAGLALFGIIRNRTLLFLVVFLLVGWHSILPGSVIERIEMTENEEGALDPSSQSRLDMWSKAFESIKSNPVTGIGFGGTKYLGIINVNRQTTRRSIHNGYIGVLIEQGFVGFFILAFIFYSGIKKGWILFRGSDDNQMKGLGLGFVAMLVASLINNLTGTNWFYFSTMGYFWIIFALVMKSYEMSVTEKAAPVEAAAVGHLSSSRL